MYFRRSSLVVRARWMDLELVNEITVVLCSMQNSCLDVVERSYCFKRSVVLVSDCFFGCQLRSRNFDPL